ncbi:MAG: ATP-dependent RecD-like DNA helicase [Clostridia bacterium]|nr:ATP-dependent RecD-like DNA helicase [Clostridia bacterium]
MKNGFDWQRKGSYGAKNRPALLGESEVEGVVQSIVFRNDNNGYTVLSLLSRGEEITCVGTMIYVQEGEHVRLTGTWTTHSVFGDQFKFEQAQTILPSSADEIERYLGSGAIKGVGVVTARLIVQTFGEETLEVLRDHPERLREVPTIGPKKARQILLSYQEQAQMRDTMLFLSRFSISPAYCNRIIRTYQENTIPIVRQNPYRLVDDVPGIGFQTADRIAMSMGIARDSEYRLRAGIRYLLYDAAQQAGHCYLPRPMLSEYVSRLLQADPERVEQAIVSLAWNRQLVLKQKDEEVIVYLPSLYAAETEVAQRLIQLRDAAAFSPMPDLTESISDYERENRLSFDPLQKRAIAMAVQEGVSVLTGGPGTGKTTVLHCVIRLFQQAGRSIALCAPTGRAAKRMTESCGMEAKTIHRLLEYLPDDGEEPRFQRDADHPLDEDAVIVDEMSMVDIHLMRSLCRALRPGSRLVMVGDMDQLPSVGAGNVLRDIIASETIQVTVLTHIFRQAASSLIVENAHAINAGIYPVLNDKTHDFFFERQESLSQTADSVIRLCASRLKNYFHLDPFRDIQVLCPMKRGETGVINLNRQLQAVLDPPSRRKQELSVGDTLFREGDKVMQIRNNYGMEWETRDGRDGTGIFNGDIGIILSIEPAARRITVCFDDEKICTYDDTLFADLDLCYAMSIHKSQGSEFRAVVLPLHSGTPLLLTRNLLYTAITRAVSLVVIVGREGTVRQMVDNNQIRDRYSALSVRLREFDGQMASDADEMQDVPLPEQITWNLSLEKEAGSPGLPAEEPTLFSPADLTPPSPPSRPSRGEKARRMMPVNRSTSLFSEEDPPYPDRDLSQRSYYDQSVEEDYSQENPFSEDS